MRFPIVGSMALTLCLVSPAHAQERPLSVEHLTDNVKVRLVAAKSSRARPGLSLQVRFRPADAEAGREVHVRLPAYNHTPLVRTLVVVILSCVEWTGERGLDAWYEPTRAEAVFSIPREQGAGYLEKLYLVSLRPLGAEDGSARTD